MHQEARGIETVKRYCMIAFVDGALAQIPMAPKAGVQPDISWPRDRLMALLHDTKRWWRRTVETKEEVTQKLKEKPTRRFQRSKLSKNDI